MGVNSVLETTTCSNGRRRRGRSRVRQRRSACDSESGPQGGTGRCAARGPLRCAVLLARTGARGGDPATRRLRDPRPEALAQPAGR